MSSEINFLQKNKRQLEKRTKDDQRSFRLVVFLSIFVVAIFLALLLIANYYQTQIKAVERQRTEIENNILQGDQRTKAYLIFYSKLQKLIELIEKRNGGTQALVSTYQYFTTLETAVINSVYDYQAQTVELTVSANSVFSLPKLMSLIQSSAFQTLYQNVEILSLNRLDNGTYSLKILLEI